MPLIRKSSNSKPIFIKRKKGKSSYIGGWCEKAFFMCWAYIFCLFHFISFFSYGKENVYQLSIDVTANWELTNRKHKQTSSSSVHCWYFVDLTKLIQLVEFLKSSSTFFCLIFTLFLVQLNNSTYEYKMKIKKDKIFVVRCTLWPKD